MKVAKRFEFCTASAFGDARLKLVHEDAAEFVTKEVRFERRVEHRKWDTRFHGDSNEFLYPRYFGVPFGCTEPIVTF